MPINLLLRDSRNASRLDHPALDIARGVYPDAVPVLKWAAHSGLGVTFNTIWGDASLYVFPTTAEVMTISSDSVDDTSAGTGAQTIVIQGLDVNYDEVTEVVSTNGLTGVPTSTAFLRINGLFVVQSGSNGTNVGNVYIGTGTITSGIPAIKYNVISTSTYGRSGSGFFTVPVGYTMYLQQLITDSSSSGRLESQLEVITSAGNKTILAQMDTEGGSFNFDIRTPFPIAEKTDLHLIARLQNPVRPVIGIISGILVNNHFPDSHKYYQFM